RRSSGRGTVRTQAVAGPCPRFRAYAWSTRKYRTPGPVDLRSVAETPRVGPATAVIGSGHLPPRGSVAEQVSSRVFLWGAGSMSDTRWLDDGDQQTWRSFLAAVHMMEARLDRQLRRDSGLPHAYFHALVALAEAPEREMTMTELA